MRFRAGLRLLRARLHARAYQEHRDGNTVTAQVLWALVDEIDALLLTLTKRKDHP